MKKILRKRFSKACLIGLFAFLALPGMYGCGGTDGSAGPAGPAGEAGEDLTAPTTAVTVAISSVAVPSPPGVQGTVVEFTVNDQDGRAVKTLPTGTNVYFTYAKLVSDAAQNTQWVSYINREESTASSPNNIGPGGTPVLPRALQANRQTATSALVNLGSGRYRYTFTSTGLTTTNLLTEPVPYAASLTNRIAIQVSGGGLMPVNKAHDFIPAGGAVSVTRNIAATASCLECHEANFGFHDASARVEVEYCVTCHNPGTTDANSGLLLDMASMTHSIHSGPNLANSPYIIWGFGGSEHDYSDVGYPQDRRNCLKCHNVADAATANGNNWKTRPTRIACGACHDEVDFATGVNHSVQSDDTACSGCHTATNIEAKHLTNNATPNNPGVPAGAVNFTYEISAVTVTASNEPVVTFRILADGSPVTLTCEGTSSHQVADSLLTGFSGSPSFLVAYADGTDTAVDFNNKGRTAAQPATARISDVCNTTAGSMAGPDANGNYTATLTVAVFPAGSAMRTIGLQGYFTQVSPALPRYTVSVTRAVTGDMARRTVVDNAKCASCHEWISLHGGNRVYETQICITCHNPNLSSSGRGADPATVLTRMSAEDQAAMTANGYNPAEPLTYPEASNNFKDMIHSLHASHVRTTRYDFVRDRGTSGVFYYDWSHVTYPSDAVSCEMCHIPGTYGVNLPTGVLPTTNVTFNGTLTRTEILAARASVPNAADQIFSPAAAACVGCHDSALSKAHMTQNGGFFGERTNYVTTETCVICHGPGRSADVGVVHGQ